MKPAVFLLGLLWASPAQSQISEEKSNFGRFGEIAILRTPHAPKHVVLFLSGDGGWNKGVVDMARRVAALDSLVVGVNVPRYLKSLEDTKEPCSFPAGDLENLSHFVQKKFEFPSYIVPFLVGYSSGATLAYASLVQAPKTTFAGSISLGFCADLEFKRKLCRGEALSSSPLGNGKGFDFAPDPGLDVSWTALNGKIDEVCHYADVVKFVEKVGHGKLIGLEKVGHGFSVEARWLPQFMAEFTRMATLKDEVSPTVAAQSSEATAKLPLKEIQSNIKSSNRTSSTLGIIVSGDGGWTSMDQVLAAKLAKGGVSVVGLDSLRYFWKRKSPETLAKGLEAIANRYRNAWNRPRLVVIGYSFGADVLPAALAKLSQATREVIDVVALVSPSPYASFEIKVAEWLDLKVDKSAPVQPELAKLGGSAVLCFWGDKDDASLCPHLSAPVQSFSFKGGHRMNDHADQIAVKILTAIDELGTEGARQVR